MMLIEDVGSNPLQPASTTTEPARRWERLIPITGLMLALALPGIFLLPAHPDIELYLHIWMLATITLFFYLRYRVRKMRSPVVEQVSKTRTLTGYQAATYQPDSSRVLRRGLVLSEFSLRIGGMMAIFAEGQLLAGTITPYLNTYSSPSISVQMGATSLMLAVLSIAIFSVTLAMRQGCPEKIISGRPAFYGSLGLFLVLFPAVSLLAFQVPRYIFVGPPAPWPTLHAFAQGHVERLAKNAVLRSVTARPPYGVSGPYSPQNTPFEVDFTFYGTSGEMVTVVVLDVDPPRLLSARSNSFSSESSEESIELLSKYRERAAAIKLSPREVYALTEEEGLAFGKEKSSTVSPYLSLALYDGGRALPGVPAWWNVDYSVNQSQGRSSLLLRVDSATGKVVARERWPEDFEKDVTPVPVASPTITP
jgi:hypothetical protein